MKARMLAAALVVALCSPALFAQTAVPANPAPPVKRPLTINQRRALQQKRIGQGVKSGQLTAGETANLERKEAGLNKEIRGMKQENGGKLTPADRKLVNKQQNSLSRQIYRKKHNARTQK